MTILFEGKMDNGEVYQLKTLSFANKSEILSLQVDTIASIDMPDSLQPLSDDEVDVILSGKGLVVGVYSNEALVAFRVLLEPPLDDEHLGLDIGLKNQQLSECIYQEISIVHPHFRGMGLQQLMGQLLMKEVKEKNYGFVLATVAPFNIPSLKDKFSHGLEIAALKFKYGGMLRYIFVKDLKLDSEFGKREQLIPMENIEKQQAVLDSGWRGVGIQCIRDEWFVVYKEKVN